MKVKYFFRMTFIALCILVPSLALGADEYVKIGDITAFSGEVLARTKGVWIKVQSAPHPVFSDDKVVTRRGRAEIGFIDGGVMRLNLDSNISIEQIQEEEGFAFKNKVSTRQVNLLVGEVWFSVKVEKGNKLNVRTPTMTAAVRGSSATIMQGVEPNVPAKYSFIEGDIETQGNFESIPPKAINWSDIRTNASDLPSSNPAVDKSQIQQSAAEATESRSKALQAASKAGEASGSAHAASQLAQSTGNVGDAYFLSALASLAVCDASSMAKQAEMVAEQEKLGEALIFNEVQKVSAVQNIISQLGQKITRLEVISQELEEIVEEVDRATKEGDLQGAEQALQKSEQLMIEVPQITITPTSISGITETTTEAAAPTEEPAATGEEALGYTEETTETTTTTTEPPPDTQDLGTSSPAY